MSAVDALRTSIEKSQSKSAGPQPKDIYTVQQWEMAGAHATLLNALLNVYEKSASIPAKKAQAFVEYALQWVAALDYHHDWEEKVYYPLFAPKYNTEAIIAEHGMFQAGVDALKAYLVSCLPPQTPWGYGQVTGAQEQQTFDGSHLQTLVDAFVSELTLHLTQELSYLEPGALRNSGLTEAEVKHIAKVSDKHTKLMVMYILPSSAMRVLTGAILPPS
ncbi:hypothetical protein DXG01_007675 [Tephrocybe rancida]|nr:hypothetical protein DXG01_007675 [Tephrocybe rancida]